MNKHYHSLLATLAVATLATTLVGCGKKEKTQAPSRDMNTMAVTQPQVVLDPNEVIVTIDGEDLTRGQIDALATQMLMSQVGGMVSQINPAELETIKAQFFDQAKEFLIIKTLIDNEIAKEDIQITDQEIDEGIQELLANLPGNITIEDVMRQTGTTEEKLREEVANQLKARKLIAQHVGDTTEATDEEIQEFYNKNREEGMFLVPENATARHIVIGVDQMDDEDARAAKKTKAEEIKKQLDEGADFVAMVEEYSDDERSKAQGGLVGPIQKSDFSGPFQQAVFEQDIDVIGPVVETDFGYHIIKVTEREPEHEQTLEEAKDRIAQFLKGRNSAEAERKYFDTLMEKASVTYPKGKEPAPAPAATAPMAPVTQPQS